MELLGQLWSHIHIGWQLIRMGLSAYPTKWFYSVEEYRIRGRTLLSHSSQGTTDAGHLVEVQVLELPWIQGQNDTWSQLGELNLSRFAHSAMLLDDSVFIIGGFPGK